MDRWIDGPMALIHPIFFLKIWMSRLILGDDEKAILTNILIMYVNNILYTLIK